MSNLDQGPHFENHQVRDTECQCGWSSVSEEATGRNGGPKSRWRLDHVGLCNTVRSLDFLQRALGSHMCLERFLVGN